MTLDLDAIAREAGFQVKIIDLNSGFDFRPPMKLVQPVSSTDISVELSRFAALLLEKAAQVCEGMHEEDRPGDYAYELRAMSAALQSSDRG